MCKLPLCRCLSKFFQMPIAAWIVILAGVGTLITAFTAQYGFGVQPCELCWFQRGPYALAIIVGSLALVSQRDENRSRLFLWIAAAIFLISMGLAIFHTGVEQHWWEDAVSCVIKPLHGVTDPEVLRKQLLDTKTVPCDQITWGLWGLSMANWNILFSLGLCVFTALAASGCCTGNEKQCRCCRSCK